MPHSFNKLWIHAIWATKNRQELIDFSIEKQVYNYIREELIELGCPVRIINGMPDHVHALFLLNPQKSISDVIKQIKGSSSHSINAENLILEKFAWQTGFAAFLGDIEGTDGADRFVRGANNDYENKGRITRPSPGTSGTGRRSGV